MPALSGTLRDTNRRLSSWLDGIDARHGQPTLITPEDMAALLSELLRVGEGLRTEPVSARANDPERDVELEKYRCHLERLRDLLPSIQGYLLAERARLEAQRVRVQSAAQWARTSRQTL